MATAAAGLAPPMNGSSSFGQFRLTQFVDNHAPKTSPNANELQAASNRDTDPEQMAQSSRPSSGQITDHAPSAGLTKLVPLEHNRNHPVSSAGFSLELVELAANPTAEGILGPNKDGRVRNPVPSKLKGKTDNKQGNFGVMHMGMSPGTGKKTEAQGRDAAAERDAAARRTSENTASRAKAAQQGKYVPPNKRGPDEGADRASPFATDKQRKRPLSPYETKVEQARLLTTLRGINPPAVVDQICKAVAYFGGIPGAPPPEDGIFPASANTGETGALFIGWLSEIFPDLVSPEVPRIQAPPAGGKKKSKAAKTKTEMPAPADEAPNPRNGFGFGQAISAPAWALPQSLALVNTVGLSPIPLGQAPVPVVEASSQGEQHTPATPIKHLSDDHTNNASGSKRGRGRPKGSTNKRSKGGAQVSIDGNGSNEVGGSQQVQQSPRVQGTAVTNTERDQTSYAHMPIKRPFEIGYPQQPWQANTAKNQHGAPAKSAPDELSPEELAVINAFRSPAGPASNSSITPNTASASLPRQISSGTGSGVKRKRAAPKQKAPAAALADHVAGIQQTAQPSTSLQNTPILHPTKASSIATPAMGSGLMGGGLIGIPKKDMQWPSVDTSTPTAPPAKKPRQRKPKAPANNDPPSKQQIASVTNQSTPTVMPSTIPDSQATSSQQSLPVTRSQAEGLEAHYERFASSSVLQQNGRGNTSSVSSISSITPQQHLRQLQKTNSIPSQSQQPSPSQAQLQMQRQKSQQSQREDQQNIPQATTARSSTAGGFYSQQQQPQRQSTYGAQQFPSHQTSQLANTYGSSHTASPQMSTNSYRTNTTHTLAQASPQFSQPDPSAYRTASPHTINQASPSFTQPESTYRAPSTNSIIQPSSTYSQPENSYRTGSSLSNTTSSYSRTPNVQTQTSHQSHYNHFPDASYVDLPTLDSLGHSGGNTTNTLSAGGYGQQGLSVGLGGSLSSTRSNSHSIYGTSSSLNNAFDTGTNDLLRGASRVSSSSGYGTTNFDTEQDMRERLMRGNMGVGGRR